MKKAMNNTKESIVKKERQKMIRLADRSTFGWELVETDELAKDNDNENESQKQRRQLSSLRKESISAEIKC